MEEYPSGCSNSSRQKAAGATGNKSSTSAKLKNLKQFLSSSRKSLLQKEHQQQQRPIPSQNHNQTPQPEVLGYTYYNDTIGNCSSSSNINNKKISTSSSHISDNHNHHHVNMNKCHSSTSSSSTTPSRPPKTISLINLRSSTKNRFPSPSTDHNKQYSSKREPLYEQIRPVSTAFDDVDPDNHNDYSQYKSKSMYGLCEKTMEDEEEEDKSHHHTSTSAIGAGLHSKDVRSYGNIPARALKLFQTIRSKFKKRRRDLNNKIVDSKSTSDFGAFQYPSKGQDSDSALKSSQSVDNVLRSLFGSRHNDDTPYEDPDDDEPDADNNEDNLATPAAASCSSSQPATPTTTNFPCDDNESDDRVFADDGNDATDNSAKQLVTNNTVSSSVSPEQLAKDLSSLRDSNDHSKTSELKATSSCMSVVPSVSLSSSNSPATPSKQEISSPQPPFKCLTKELDDLFHHGWYWAGLSKEEAEAKLRGQPDGAFIVRDSTSSHYLLSLSFNSNGRCLHTRIEYRGGQFNFYSNEEDSFPSVAELIEHCITYSELGVFCYSVSRRGNLPSFPVRLIKPISRFTEVKSLAYLSRFVIRKYVRLDLIPQLPLPQRVIEYVSEQRYI